MAKRIEDIEPPQKLTDEQINRRLNLVAAAHEDANNYCDDLRGEFDSIKSAFEDIADHLRDCENKDKAPDFGYLSPLIDSIEESIQSHMKSIDSIEGAVSKGIRTLPPFTVVDLAENESTE